jgi:RNA polymerase sigma-70 factor (ECF subfamily)
MRLAAEPTTDLLPLIANGRRDAVEQCIDRYGPIVLGLARRYFRDPATADDAVQDVFIDVWRSAGRYDPAVAPEAVFIMQIARRRMIDRLRRQPAPAAALDDAPEPAETPADTLEISEQASQAMAALARLPEPQQRVLEWSIRHGRSYEQIARIMRLPLGTVKSHARRGLLRVRELLGIL